MHSRDIMVCTMYILLASLVTEVIVVGVINTIFLILFVVAGIRQMRKERSE